MVDKQPQKRPMRFSDAELSLLQNTFSERMDLLIVLRKKFLQLELNKEQELLLDVFGNKDVQKVIEKIFLPTMTGDEPFNEMFDLYITTELKGKDIEMGYMEMAAREELVRFTREFLDELVLGIKKTMIFEDYRFIKDDQWLTYYNFYVRNTLIAHVEGRIQQIFMLAGKKDEDPEDKKKRLQQDSSQ